MALGSSGRLQKRRDGEHLALTVSFYNLFRRFSPSTQPDFSPLEPVLHTPRLAAVWYTEFQVYSPKFYP